MADKMCDTVRSGDGDGLVVRAVIYDYEHYFVYAWDVLWNGF
jgi:hypothetical protein